MHALSQMLGLNQSFHRIKTTVESGPKGDAVAEPEHIDEFHYEIDEANRVTDVDRPWLAFARANGAPELTREAVIGAGLFRFVAGWEAVRHYGELFDALRSSRSSATLPFRCDSPETRRYMQLTMQANTKRHVRLVGRLLQREAREAVPVLDPKVPRDGHWLVICSMCLQLETDSGGWSEIEAALSDPHVVPEPGLPRLSHTLCPSCARHFRDAIRTARPR